MFDVLPQLVDLAKWLVRRRISYFRGVVFAESQDPMRFWHSVGLRFSHRFFFFVFRLASRRANSCPSSSVSACAIRNQLTVSSCCVTNTTESRVSAADFFHRIVSLPPGTELLRFVSSLFAILIRFSCLDSLLRSAPGSVFVSARAPLHWCSARAASKSRRRRPLSFRQRVARSHATVPQRLQHAPADARRQQVSLAFAALARQWRKQRRSRRRARSLFAFV